MLRIQASRLDGYDYWLRSDHDMEWFADDLLYREETPAMIRGTQCHAALERAAAAGSEVEGWDSDMRIALPRPDLVELSVQREIAPGLLLTGRLDAICGTTGVDYKTTGRAIDLERYTDSWQWRAYLAMMPRLERFRYDAFQLAARADVIVDWQHVEMCRYAGVDADVQDVARRYAETIYAMRDAGLLTVTPWGGLAGC